MSAPSFTLPNQDGVPVSLSDFSGRWLIVYFYPKDDTPGCTTEACSFRDQIQEFEGKKVSVVGISKDTVTSHRKFVNKYELPFSVLSDPTTETIKAYGAWGLKKFMGKEFESILRQTVIVSPQGEIVQRYENVTPTDHAIQILEDLERLQAAG